MFETAALNPGSPSHRVWTTLAGVTGQVALVTCAFLAPLISPQALPRAQWITSITAPGPPTAPVSDLIVIRPKTALGAARQILRNVLIAPTRVPAKAAMIEDAPVWAEAGVTAGAIPSDQNGVTGGLLTSLLTDTTRMVPIMKPPAPVANTASKPSAVPKPVRVSVLEMARPIHRVEPVYPLLAKQMRIAGVVELQGVVGVDGRIHELKVLSGHPMLVKADVDAVIQWIYAPTILNGQAVEVAAPITVAFRLN